MKLQVEKETQLQQSRWVQILNSWWIVRHTSCRPDVGVINTQVHEGNQWFYLQLVKSCCWCESRKRIQNKKKSRNKMLKLQVWLCVCFRVKPGFVSSDQSTKKHKLQIFNPVFLEAGLMVSDSWLTAIILLRHVELKLWLKKRHLEPNQVLKIL